MASDPWAFVNSVHYSLDALRVDSSITSAVTLARTDPFAGLGAVIGTGDALRTLMSPASQVFGSHALTSMDVASTLSSLSAFKAPFDSLTGLAIAAPFRGTISSLASVASVGDSIRAAYGTMPATTAYVSTVGAARGLGLSDAVLSARSLASPYLASAASVYSLESSFAHIFSATPAGTISSLAASLPGIPAGSFDYLHSGVTSMCSAALSTWETFGRDTTVLANSALATLRAPAVELYACTQVAAAVTLHSEGLPPLQAELEDSLQEDVDGLEPRLAALDHDLVQVYRGAIGAIETGGPDWQRHSMASLRELSTHVLHKLAPDEQVMPKARPDDLHDGKPTRRARLNFIFSDIAGSELAAFYEVDMKAAVALFELLNSGTHKLGNKATPEQVRYLRGRAAGLLSSMLAARGL